MPKQEHLLVFRFSSLGDVAMTVPVLQLLLQQHPRLTITVVSTEFMRPLFQGHERMRFHPADLRGLHKGVNGLRRLYHELKKVKATAIADLHNVIRTKMMRSFFIFSGLKTAVIDKGRREKKELTREKNKNLHPLKSNFQRYADVFAELGYPVRLQKEGSLLAFPKPAELLQLKASGKKLVGIAPFALHREKTYPAEQMLEVIRMLAQDPSIEILLFGGPSDKKTIQSWSSRYDRVRSMAGIMGFEKELHHISALDLMVSMDSANMHLASVSGVPVVSIWGGTHPYLGFYGWQQDPANAVQISLDCRPSSVFGNKACHNDLACMKGISPVLVYEKIRQQLDKTSI